MDQAEQEEEKKVKKGQEQGEGVPYYVKFVLEGKPRYGIVNIWSKEGRMMVLAGYYLVKDAIFPLEVKMKKNRIIVADTDGYCRFVKKEFEAAIREAKKIPYVDAVRAGHILGVGVVDGIAWYIVTEVEGETCRVSWRGWHPGRWRAPFLGWGGKFKTRDIEPLVLDEKSLKIRPTSMNLWTWSRENIGCGIKPV